MSLSSWFKVIRRSFFYFLTFHFRAVEMLVDELVFVAVLTYQKYQCLSTANALNLTSFR